jgi:bacillithiol system protein YtxJ
MHWIHLTADDQLQKIIVKSQEKPQVIFKYSSCCQFSEVVFQRLQKNGCHGEVDFHFLDLNDYGHISEKIAETFGVPHQSPQILLINEGQCIFHESHPEISLEGILQHVTVAA